MGAWGIKALERDEEETDCKGSFAGSVLLSKAEWDKEQFIRDCRKNGALWMMGRKRAAKMVRTVMTLW